MTRQTCTFCDADLGEHTSYGLEERRSRVHLLFDCSALTEEERRWIRETQPEPYGEREVRDAVARVRKTSAQLQAEVREFCEEGDKHPYQPDPYHADDDRLPACDRCGASPLSHD